MSKSDFMKYARKRLDEKKIKEHKKEADYFAVKEAGWKRSRFKMGER